MNDKRYLPPGKRVMMGNVAMAEGAMAAGLSFFAGYPITPSTEVPEHLSTRLPETGGCFMQMEDELASINAVLGASIAGARAMTATSGPGMALMAETMSWAASLEIPLVVCDVQRNGPGTGLVTAPHHNDVMQCKYGGNGEYEVIAFAPMSCQELYELTIDAFNMAQRWRCPVFVMSDAYLGHLHEPVVIPPPAAVRARVIDPPAPAAAGNAMFTSRDARGTLTVPPAPVLGTPRFPGFLFSQPRGPDGVLVDEEKSQQFVEDICWKITRNVSEIAKIERYMMDDAEIVIVAYGLPARVSYRVVKQARQAGIKVGLYRLVTIWPFPYDDLKRTLAGAKAVIMPELNLGLMAGEVERVTSLPVRRVPRISEIHHPDEIMKVVTEVSRA